MSLTKFTFRHITDPTHIITATAFVTKKKFDPQTLVGASYRLIEKSPETYTHQKQADSIAECLSGNWKAVPRSKDRADCFFSLVRADGLELYLSLREALKGKMNISMCYPFDSHRRYVTVYDRKNGRDIPPPSIGVSINKSPEQLARDIEKRLLPECDVIMPLLQEEIRKTEDSYAREAAIKKAAEALPTNGPLSFETCGSSTRVSGYLSIEQAGKLAKLIKNL